MKNTKKNIDLLIKVCENVFNNGQIEGGKYISSKKRYCATCKRDKKEWSWKRAYCRFCDNNLCRITHKKSRYNIDIYKNKYFRLIKRRYDNDGFIHLVLKYLYNDIKNMDFDDLKFIDNDLIPFIEKHIDDFAQVDKKYEITFKNTDIRMSSITSVCYLLHHTNLNIVKK